MPRTRARAFRTSTNDGGNHADEVSPLSSPHDDLNQQIIRLLQNDGRATYDTMGEKLGVSGGTVRNRVTQDARGGHAPHRGRGGPGGGRL